MIVHAFALLVAANPALVVEVSAEHDLALVRDVRGALVTRLLEEGYDVVAPPARADARVEVTLGPTWSLQVDRPEGGTRSEIEIGARSVLELELGHRVLLALEDLPAEAAPGGTALSLRGTGAGADWFLHAVIEQAQLAGVRLTGRPTDDDVLLCATDRDGSAAVSVGRSSTGCDGEPATIAADADTDLAARHAVDAAFAQMIDVQAAQVGRADVREVEAAPRGGTRSWIRDDMVALRGPPRAEWRLGVDGGVASRGAVDAVVHVWTRLGKYSGPGGRIDLQVIPSGGGQARIVDTILLAGPDWQVRLGRRTRLTVGAVVGADVHAYQIFDRRAAHVTWTVALPADLSWGLGDAARVHLALLAGVSGAGARHQVEDGTWSRAAWRLGATAGFSYGWRIE